MFVCTRSQYYETQIKHKRIIKHLMKLNQFTSKTAPDIQEEAAVYLRRMIFRFSTYINYTNDIYL